MLGVRLTLFYIEFNVWIFCITSISSNKNFTWIPLALGGLWKCISIWGSFPLWKTLKIFLFYWAAICLPIIHIHFFSSTIYCPHRTRVSLCHVFFPCLFFFKISKFFMRYIPCNILVTFLNLIISYLAPYAAGLKYMCFVMHILVQET